MSQLTSAPVAHNPTATPTRLNSAQPRSNLTAVQHQMTPSPGARAITRRYPSSVVVRIMRRPVVTDRRERIDCTRGEEGDGNGEREGDRVRKRLRSKRAA